jgi:hypothetical protein
VTKGVVIGTEGHFAKFRPQGYPPILWISRFDQRDARPLEHILERGARGVVHLRGYDLNSVGVTNTDRRANTAIVDAPAGVPHARAAEFV